MSILYNCQEGACVKLIRARLLILISSSIVAFNLHTSHVRMAPADKLWEISLDKLLSGQVKAKAADVAERQPGAAILR